MAIPVGRVRVELPAERLPLYGARTAAFGGYVAALILALVLIGQALGPDAASTAELPQAQLVEARAGDSVAGLAAREGVSVVRLLALNPELAPFGPEPGQPVQVR